MSHQTLLIIDDDRDDINIFAEALQEIDETIKFFSFVESENIIDSLDKLPVLPDYIFLDLNMPKVTGKECLVQLKANPRYAPIPVIILSTSVFLKDIREAKELGASYYISKANNFPALKASISFILSGEWKADSRP